MVKLWLKQAWRSSRQYWKPYLLVPGVFAVIAILIQFAITDEGTRMSEIVSWVVWTGVPAIIGGILVFLWHFIRAPYQLLKKEHEAVKEQLSGASELIKDEKAKRADPQKFVFPYVRAVNAYAAVLSGENYITVDVYFPSALAAEVTLSQVSGQLFVNHIPLDLKPKSVTILKYTTQQAQWHVDLTKQAKDSVLRSYNENVPISVVVKLEDMNNTKYRWETPEWTTLLITKLN